MASLSTWLRTLRHVRLSMLVGRARLFVKRRFCRPGLRELRAWRAEAAAPDLGCYVRFWAPDRSQVKTPEEPTTVLRRARGQGPGVDWPFLNSSKYIRFQLHSFRWLESLTHAEALILIEDWIRHHHVPSEDAWDPYPLSLRVVSWLKFLAQCREGLAASGRARAISRSLYAQGCHLERNIETHLRCNHLLENARALLFLGCAFRTERAERWRRLGLKLLDEAVREQFFEDGCHVERAPMYHLLATEALLDCAELLKERGEVIPDEWLVRLQKAASFAEAFLHPDGELVLFNDSVLGAARSPAEISRRVAGLTGSFPSVCSPGDSAFRFVRSEGLFLAVDGGGPYPPYNPAHSHAGALSYEISLAGRRIVTDSGLGEYLPSAVRTYCRSTRAHNTVCVDGGDQSEMWSVFRIGGRSRCEISPLENEAGIVRLSGSCRWWDGSAEHSRRWTVMPGSGVLIADSVRATGSAKIESLIHLAPGCSVEQAGERSCRIAVGSECFEFVASMPWRMELRSCSIWRRYGEEERSTAIVLCAEGHSVQGAYFLGVAGRRAGFDPHRRIFSVDGVELAW